MTTPHRPGVLGCGLTGFVPNKKNSANLDWIKLILAYNSERGTDSCGLFMNNSSRKGVKTESDVKNFLARNPLVNDPKCKNKVIIGHTRKATYGAHNESNAHPFMYEHEGKTIVLAHNGSISNSFDFSKEFGVPDLYKLDVDSQRLAMTLLQTGTYDVLEFYKGYAALIWTYLEEPNVVYVFKGGSKSVKTGPVIEERPLFFIETAEGIYISSMREPLDACCNQELTVYTPTENVVYRIENNQCKPIATIKREEANLFTTPVPQVTSAKQAITVTTNTTETGIDLFKRSIDVTTTPKIYDEVASDSFNPHVAAVGDKIYYLAGRYYSIPCSQVVAFNKVHDLFTPDESDTYEFLLHGEFNIFNTETNRDTKNYYVSASTNSTSRKFFYEGVLIDDSKLDRFKTRVMKRLPTMNVFEKIRQLSSFSKHPITFCHSDYLKINNEDIKYYWNGKIIGFDMIVKPAMSNRKYSFSKEGYLVKVTSISSDPIFSIEIISDVKRSLTIPSYDQSDVDFSEYTDSTDSEKHLKVVVIPNAVGSKSLWRYKSSDEIESGVYEAEFLHGLDPDSWYFLGDSAWALHGEKILITALTLLIRETLSLYGDGSHVDSETLSEYDAYVSERVKDLYINGIESQTGLLTYLKNEFKTIEFDDTYLKRGALSVLRKTEEVEDNTGDIYNSQGLRL